MARSPQAWKISISLGKGFQVKVIVYPGSQLIYKCIKKEEHWAVRW